MDTERTTFDTGRPETTASINSENEGLKLVEKGGTHWESKEAFHQWLISTQTGTFEPIDLKTFQSLFSVGSNSSHIVPHRDFIKAYPVKNTTYLTVSKQLKVENHKGSVFVVPIDHDAQIHAASHLVDCLSLRPYPAWTTVWQNNPNVSSALVFQDQQFHAPLPRSGGTLPENVANKINELKETGTTTIIVNEYPEVSSDWEDLASRQKDTTAYVIKLEGRDASPSDDVPDKEPSAKEESMRIMTKDLKPTFPEPRSLVEMLLAFPGAQAAALEMSVTPNTFVSAASTYANGLDHEGHTSCHIIHPIISVVDRVYSREYTSSEGPRLRRVTVPIDDFLKAALIEEMSRVARTMSAHDTYSGDSIVEQSLKNLQGRTDFVPPSGEVSNTFSIGNWSGSKLWFHFAGPDQLASELV